MKYYNNINSCLKGFKLDPDELWFTYEKHGKQIYCRISEILYLESQEKKIRIVKKSGEDTFYGNISRLAEKLEPQQFLLCHKSLLVNYRHIAEYQGDEIVLSNGETLPVSRRKKKFVMEQLQKWMTEYVERLTE